MKYFFSIAKYADYRQEIFEKYISPRNQEYCNKHGYKYVVIDNSINMPVIRDNPIWWKLFIIKDLLKNNKLQYGDEIVAFDADCYITNLDTSLTPDKSMIYAIDSGNSHCMGWYSFIINDWSIKFIDLLTDEKRFDIWKDKSTFHPHFKSFSPLWRIWAEQASFYGLAGIIRHSNVSFWEMKNYGYHSEPTESTLPLEELRENITVLPTSYNVTIWPDENTDTTFYINKIENKEEVRIRHLTGCSWNNIRNWI